MHVIARAGKGNLPFLVHTLRTQLDYIFDLIVVIVIFSSNIQQQ